MIASVPTARVAGGLGERLLSSARYAVDDDRPIIGYVVIGLYEDGGTVCGGGTEFPEGTALPLNRYMWVGMCAERIREHFITDPAAADAVNRANGWDI